MNTTNNQNDPYAHLKQAWEEGRRIRTRWEGSDGWSEWNQPGDVVFWWNLPPDCYEIEPTPADKWAKEKAAHAQGKKIEMLISDDEYGPERWSFCELPDWYDRCEYRIAPDPAPAGKLTDEQLGEIGAKAVIYNTSSIGAIWVNQKITANWNNDAPARTAFARAVRETVEAKQAEEIARLRNGCIELSHALSRIDYACGEPNEMEVSSYCVHQNEGAVVETVKKVVAELAKANAELERLRWRSVEVKPTREDGDCNGNIEAITPKGRILLRMVNTWPWELNHTTAHEVTHWRPFCPPPAPTAEEVERDRFEIWAATSSFGHDLTRTPCGKYYNSVLTCEAWELWQAARAAKEGDK